MTYIKRLLSLLKDRSFFLFGAINTGKSTLIREEFRGISAL
jgi:AAA+ ATPase superfamily predicted ATPase